MGGDNNWSSVADLFSGLMIIFLFIAIAMMIEAKKESAQVELLKEDLEALASSYDADKEFFYKLLQEEFSNDFSKWNAQLDKDLTIRFNNPDILFKSGSSEISDEFKVILKSFWPRYIKIVSLYKEKISHVSLEGHTSSFWCKKCSDEFSYFNNMKLSQERSYEVLRWCWSQSDDKEVIKEMVVATGLSYSRLIKKDGVENSELSKRVEFSLKLNAEEIISKMKKDN